MPKAKGFVESVFEGCQNVEIEEVVSGRGASKDYDIRVDMATAGTGRYEWDVAVERLEEIATNRLNFRLLMRKNNENVEDDQFLPEDREHVQAYDRLRKKKNAMFLTVDYHFDKGVWPVTESANNLEALQLFRKAVQNTPGLDMCRWTPLLSPEAKRPQKPKKKKNDGTIRVFKDEALSYSKGTQEFLNAIVQQCPRLQYTQSRQGADVQVYLKHRGAGPFEWHDFLESFKTEAKLAPDARLNVALVMNRLPHPSEGEAKNVYPAHGYEIPDGPFVTEVEFREELKKARTIIPTLEYHHARGVYPVEESETNKAAMYSILDALRETFGTGICKKIWKRGRPTLTLKYLIDDTPSTSFSLAVSKSLAEKGPLYYDIVLKEVTGLDVPDLVIKAISDTLRDGWWNGDALTDRKLEEYLAQQAEDTIVVFAAVKQNTEWPKGPAPALVGPESSQDSFKKKHPNAFFATFEAQLGNVHRPGGTVIPAIAEASKHNDAQVDHILREIRRITRHATLTDLLEFYDKVKKQAPAVHEAFLQANPSSNVSAARLALSGHNELLHEYNELILNVFGPTGPS